MAGAVFALLGTFWFALITLSSVLGLAALPEDARGASRKAAVALEWLLAADPNMSLLLVALMLVLGALLLFWTPTAGRSAPGVPEAVTERVEVAAKPAEERPSRPLPRMSLGDAVRYIAEGSTWAHELGARDDWMHLLEREVIDQLAADNLRAHGRFQTSTRPGRGTAALQEIWPHFWSNADIEALRYFYGGEDPNSARGGTDSYFFDIRLHREDVERVWPRAREVDVSPLPGLYEVLESRGARPL